jgi:hypothetical protein
MIGFSKTVGKHASYTLERYVHLLKTYKQREINSMISDSKAMKYQSLKVENKKEGQEGKNT